jgi:hypothetical protein
MASLLLVNPVSAVETGFFGDQEPGFQGRDRFNWRLESLDTL